MDILFIAIWTIVGGAIGFTVGWHVNGWLIRRRNRAIALKMVESVKATKSRRDPANMMPYDNRQRTAGSESAIPARQGKVRFRSRPVRR
jgi:hypothetical protein